ncbi:MAG TPA: hypothetical protein PLB01_02750 [Thermoanaerobaculia bacterium]|nr:hypothetical protein [Thermoanaerobaculia bacterium]
MKIGDEKTPCTCGHARDEHRGTISDVGGLVGSYGLECLVAGCDCPRYAPDDEDEDSDA